MPNYIVICQKCYTFHNKNKLDIYHYIFSCEIYAVK